MSTGLSSFSVSIKQLPSFRTPHLINAIFLLAVLLCPAFCAFASPTSSPAPTQASATTPQNNSVNTQSAPPASTDNDRLPFMIEERQEAPAPSGAGLIMRTLGALMLIVGMIAAGAWALKKYGGSRFGSASPDAPALQVMSSVGLGDKRSLAVVRFGERVLLVASTPQAVTLLAEHQTSPKASDTQDTDLENEPPAFRSVADLLSEGHSNIFAEELVQAEKRIATESKEEES